MADPTYNKAAAVRIYALTSAGVEVPLRADASGNLVLGADIDIDTTGLASSAKQDTAQTTLTAIDGHVDGLETAVASTNTKLDTVNTNLGTIDGHVDGLETAVAATNTALELLKLPTTFSAITPSDSTNVTSTCTKGLIVTVAGVVNLTGVGGSAVALGTLPAGTIIPVALSRVNAATTATVLGLSGP